MNKLEEIGRALSHSLNKETEDSMWTDASFIRMARSVVKALREPTEWMVFEGDKCRADGLPPRECVLYWSVMIDAILSEPQTSSKPLPSSDPCQHLWKRGDITWSCDRCGIVKLRKRYPEGQGPELTIPQIEAMERGGK